MFRTVISSLGRSASQAMRNNVSRTSVAVTSRHMSAHSQVDDAEFDEKMESFLNRADLDGWGLRDAMNELQGMDMVPEPKIIIAAMKACRRVNDHSLAVRYLEAVKSKCGNRVGEIWPYIQTEIKPTLDDLGIFTPEEMGYDKPELALTDVYDIHS